MHYVVANTFIELYQTSFLGLFQKIHIDYDEKQFAHRFDADQKVKLFQSYQEAEQFAGLQYDCDDYGGLFDDCWSIKTLLIYEVSLVKDFDIEAYTPNHLNYREIPGNMVLYTLSIFAGGKKINHILEDKLDNDDSSISSLAP
jgi:hypothetical protein